MMMKLILWTFTLALVRAPLQAQTTPAPPELAPRFLRVVAIERENPELEEFFGPYPSWLDVRRDFGARGDGVTDDTVALQAALDGIRSPSGPSVLYLPAGIYRITRMLEVKRTGHEDSKDIMILGEHPENTILRWNGPKGGTMLKFGAWWSRLGRLTLDGQQSARCALKHGDLFASVNELSDLVIRDVGIGIEAGTMTNAPVAETAVLRCRFHRCSITAISVGNWNSLDWFIWDSEFTECRLGVVNVFGAGNFHLYRCLFNRSQDADVAIGNTGYFSVRQCTSIGSRRFFGAASSGAPALITLQGNLILDTAETPIVIGNMGPLILLDNVIRCGNMPGLRLEKPTAGLLAIGNELSTSNALPRTRRTTSFDNRFVGLETATPLHLSLPSVPPRSSRQSIEVPANATAHQIQEIINAGSEAREKAPVIHFPAGLYFIDRTVTVPAGSDLQLVGDGGRTVLKWTGGTTGKLFDIRGPSHIGIRDLRLHGSGKAVCISISGCDQSGARLVLEQVDVRHHSKAGLMVRGLSQLQVRGQSFYHSTSRPGIQVIGPGATYPGSNSAMVALYGGASSDNPLCYEVAEGGQLLVQDVWYETQLSSCPSFMRCTGYGKFTLHGATVAPQQSILEEPAMLVDGFRGNLCLLATMFNFANTRVAIRNPRPETKILLAAIISPTQSELPAASKSSQLACSISDTSGGAAPIPDIGPVDPAFLTEMLWLTRSQKPEPLSDLPTQVSDIRFHRLFAESGECGLMVEP